MSVVENYARPIFIDITSLAQTTTTAIGRSTRLAAISAKPTEDDLIVRLYDGAGGQEVWRVEADNGAGSHFETFDPPLLFPHGIYVVTEGGGTDSCVCLSVIEPMPTP